ncbi:MAG: hypothetical protein ACRDWI_10085 [Jiangellaceae bacterium]
MTKQPPVGGRVARAAQHVHVVDAELDDAAAGVRVHAQVGSCGGQDDH